LVRAERGVRGAGVRGRLDYRSTVRQRRTRVAAPSVRHRRPRLDHRRDARGNVDRTPERAEPESSGRSGGRGRTHTCSARAEAREHVTTGCGPGEEEGREGEQVARVLEREK